VRGKAKSILHHKVSPVSGCERSNGLGQPCFEALIPCQTWPHALGFPIRIRYPSTALAAATHGPPCASSFKWTRRASSKPRFIHCVERKSVFLPLPLPLVEGRGEGQRPWPGAAVSKPKRLSFNHGERGAAARPHPNPLPEGEGVKPRPG